MAFRFPKQALGALLVVAGLSAARPAWALTCDEIVSMVGFNIPTHIIVQTMEGSGTQFSAADIQCLQQHDAPAEVVAAAKKMQAGSTAAPPAPEPAPTTMHRPAPQPEPDVPLLDMGDDTQSLNTQVEEVDEGGGPARVEELVRLYRAKKLLTASKGLYDLLQQGTYPGSEDKIEYYLAKSLYDLGMYEGAQHYFMEVVRKGPSRPYFKYALPKLVAIADLTGNDTELLRIVAKIPPEAFPRQAKNHLAYLMGRKLYENGELAASARYFQQISPRSDLYMRSKYFEGEIHNERGKLKSAVKAFRDVYQADLQTNAPRQREQANDLKQLALMDIARIYYGLEHYDTASEFYGRVDRDSSYWPQSLFERAWATFMKNDLNGTLGLLLTDASPHYAENEYLPEAKLLRALTFFQLCEYDDVQGILVDFEKTYNPMLEEMRAFLDKYDSPEGRQLSDQAYATYFDKPHPNTTFDKALFLRILRNTDLAALVRQLELMDKEQQLIEAQKPIWRDSVGKNLEQVIAHDRLRYEKRAGLVLLQEMAKQYEYLKDLISQSEVIRFEVVDAQRVDYEYKMQNPMVESEASRRIDYGTSRTVIYWPFNGEFWKDELGYYRYTETPACK